MGVSQRDPAKIAIEFPKPPAPAIFVAFVGGVDAQARLDVDGVEVLIADADRVSACGPCSDAEKPGAFLATVELPIALPKGSHRLRVHGTIPVLVGRGGETRTVPLPADPANLKVTIGRLELSGLSFWLDPERRRRLTIGAQGYADTLDGIEFIDATGRVIPSEDGGSYGFSSGGNLYGSVAFNLLEDGEIAALRIRTWGAIQIWNVPFDVTGTIE